jgi:hypothetical protein
MPSAAATGEGKQVVVLVVVLAVVLATAGF